MHLGHSGEVKLLILIGGINIPLIIRLNGGINRIKEFRNRLYIDLTLLNTKRHGREKQFIFVHRSRFSTLKPASPTSPTSLFLSSGH